MRFCADRHRHLLRQPDAVGALGLGNQVKLAQRSEPLSALITRRLKLLKKRPGGAQRNDGTAGGCAPLMPTGSCARSTARDAGQVYVAYATQLRRNNAKT